MDTQSNPVGSNNRTAATRARAQSAPEPSPATKRANPLAAAEVGRKASAVNINSSQNNSSDIRTPAQPHIASPTTLASPNTNHLDFNTKNNQEKIAKLKQATNDRLPGAPEGEKSRLERRLENIFALEEFLTTAPNATLQLTEGWYGDKPRNHIGKSEFDTFTITLTDSTEITWKLDSSIGLIDNSSKLPAVENLNNNLINHGLYSSTKDTITTTQYKAVTFSGEKSLEKAIKGLCSTQGDGNSPIDINTYFTNLEAIKNQFPDSKRGNPLPLKVTTKLTELINQEINLELDGVKIPDKFKLDLAALKNKASDLTALKLELLQQESFLYQVKLTHNAMKTIHKPIAKEIMNAIKTETANKQFKPNRGEQVKNAAKELGKGIGKLVGGAVALPLGITGGVIGGISGLVTGLFPGNSIKEEMPKQAKTLATGAIALPLGISVVALGGIAGVIEGLARSVTMRSFKRGFEKAVVWKLAKDVISKPDHLFSTAKRAGQLKGLKISRGESTSDKLTQKSIQNVLGKKGNPNIPGYGPIVTKIVDTIKENDTYRSNFEHLCETNNIPIKTTWKGNPNYKKAAKELYTKLLNHRLSQSFKHKQADMSFRGGLGAKSEVTPFTNKRQNHDSETKVSCTTFQRDSMPPAGTHKKQVTHVGNLQEGRFTISPTDSKNPKGLEGQIVKCLRKGVLATIKGDNIAGANKAKAIQLVKAAIIQHLETRGFPDNKELTINMLSCSLLTPDDLRTGIDGEKSMVEQEIAALKDVKQLTAAEKLDILNSIEVDGTTLTTKGITLDNLKINTFGFNHGVNQGAILGRDNEVRYNTEALNDLKTHVDGLNQDKKDIFNAIQDQKDVLNNVILNRLKTASGTAEVNPYLAPTLLLVAGHFLGMVNIFGCKSGKDRTAMQQSMLEFFMLRMHTHMTGSPPKHKATAISAATQDFLALESLTLNADGSTNYSAPPNKYIKTQIQEMQAQFAEISTKLSLDVQAENTGFPGYKLVGIDKENLFKKFSGFSNIHALHGYCQMTST